MPKDCYIIFDFDGTIGDTIELALDSYNKITEEHHLKPLNNQDRALIKSKQPRELFKAAGISGLKLPLIILAIRKEMNHSIGDMKVIPGMDDALRAIQEQGYQLGILTSNSVENINIFLEKNGLKNLFNFVHSEKSFFGKSKVINKLMKQYVIEKQNAIYVGDETRDIEAAHKSGIAGIGVTWGMNNRNLLESVHPDCITDSPGNLIQCIERIFSTRK
ncbi:MAG: HAD-IA family hydrolase [Chitinophagaceae bacterium]|nr:HAD-IA family hydrolase [Chitinophagaceae bacterium]